MGGLHSKPATATATARADTYYTDYTDPADWRTDGRLGLDSFVFDGNDLGKLLASRGRSTKKNETVPAKTPAVDAIGWIRVIRVIRVSSLLFRRYRLRCAEPNAVVPHGGDKTER